MIRNLHCYHDHDEAMIRVEAEPRRGGSGGSMKLGPMMRGCSEINTNLSTPDFGSVGTAHSNSDVVFGLEVPGRIACRLT